MTFKTKYNVGEEVWVMRSNNPTCVKISAIAIGCYGVGIENTNINYSFLGVSSESYRENKVFPSKGKLIKSLQ